MTTAQLTKYRVNLSKWRAARKAAGKPHDDVARYEMHRKAIGRACSSTEFTNHEFDMVLAVMAAEFAPADLNAQMRQQDQLDYRLQELRARVAQLAPSAGIERGADGVSAYFRRFLNGRHVDRLDERTLQKLVGMLERRGKQLVPTSGEEDDGDPF